MATIKTSGHDCSEVQENQAHCGEQADVRLMIQVACCNAVAVAFCTAVLLSCSYVVRKLYVINMGLSINSLENR